MATFELSGPDGATYHVDAPDEGAALQAFQSFSGPPPKQSLTDAVTDVPSEIGSAASGAFDAIKNGLNPFSDARRQALIDSVSQTIPQRLATGAGQMADMGRGLAAIPALAGAPITGAARSLIGHPYSMLTGIPYEQSKDAVDTAMMAMKPAGIGRVPGGVGQIAQEAKPLPAPSTAATKNAATAEYRGITEAGNAIPVEPSVVADLTSGIKASLNKEGLRPSVAGKTHAALDEIAAASEAAPDLTELIAGKRTLKEIAGGNDPTERKAAMMAMPQIDAKLAELAPDIAPRLKTADATYAAAMQARMVEKAIEKATNNAKAAGSGGNLDNATRQQFRSILNSEKKLRGLTQDEVAAVRELATGTPGRNALRLIGKLDPMAGGLNAMLQLAATVSTGGLNIPVAIAGTIARHMAEKATTNAALALSEKIRGRSPLAQSIPVPAPVPVPLPSVPLSALASTVGAGSLLNLLPRSKSRQ